MFESRSCKDLAKDFSIQGHTGYVSTVSAVCFFGEVAFARWRGWVGCRIIPAEKGISAYQTSCKCLATDYSQVSPITMNCGPCFADKWPLRSLWPGSSPTLMSSVFWSRLGAGAGAVGLVSFPIEIIPSFRENIQTNEIYREGKHFDKQK